MSSEYGELRPTSGWDLLASLGHPWKFQRALRLCSTTARHSSSRCQPDFAALNRGRHVHSAGRPSRWALAHISSFVGLREHLYWYLSLTKCLLIIMITSRQVIWHEAASPPQTDGSVVFARWRQYASPSSTPQLASAPYCCWPPLSCFETRVSVVEHSRACPRLAPFRTQNCPFTWGIWSPI